MDSILRRWFAASTFSGADFDLDQLVGLKVASGQTVSVVIPARNEATTVASVVSQIGATLVEPG
ncbi:MAG: glucosyl-3-phosphoglycerate synthase, partial [Jatrophihabitantaceae bacterium]